MCKGKFSKFHNYEKNKKTRFREVRNVTTDLQKAQKWYQRFNSLQNIMSAMRKYIIQFVQ